MSSPARPAPAAGRSAVLEAQLRALGSHPFLARGWGGPLLVGLAFTLLYGWVSLRKHYNLNTGMDLVIFDQAVRHWAHFEPGMTVMKGQDTNIFGDHFHPILLLLTPLYWIWDDPRMLLIAQAVLLGATTVIIARIGQRHLGSAGVLVAGAFAISQGVQAAMLFDFHEVALGAPILALALGAFIDERYTKAAVLTCLMLLVKEDAAFIVAGVGMALFFRKQYRTGVALGALSVIWLLLCVKVIIPAFNPLHVYLHTQGEGRNPFSAAVWGNFFNSLIYPGTATITAITLVLGTAGLALRSPLIWAAVIPFLVRASSANSNYWIIAYHYRLLTEVVLFMAAIDVLRRIRWREVALGVIALAAVLSLLAGHLSFNVFRPLNYRHDAALRALAVVPDGANVSTDVFLAPQITHRANVGQIRPPNYTDDVGASQLVDWLVVDRSTISYNGTWWIDGFLQQRAEDYDVVYDADGFVVLHRKQP